MTPFRRSIHVQHALVCATLAASCGADLSVPDGVRIACASEADCPAGYACRTTIGLCVRDGEASQPAPRIVPGSELIAPATVAVGDRIDVRFSVDQPLFASPSVQLLAATPVALTLRSSESLDYLFGYVVTGTEPAGSVTIATSLLGLNGQLALGLVLGSVVFDFTAPSVQDLTAESSSVLAAGASAVVSFVVSESLSAAVVTLNGRPMQADAGASPPLYRYRYLVDGTEAEGLARLQLTVTDLAGNTVGPSTSSPFTLDFTAPSVELPSLSATASAGADNYIGRQAGGPEALTHDGSVRVSFRVSEPLGAPPEIALVRADTSGPLPAGLVEVAGTFVFAVASMGDAAAQEGAYTAVRIALTDVAGNRSTRDYLFGTEVSGPAGPIAVDFTPPAQAATDTARRVVFTRAPWGQQASGHQPRFTVTGGAGAVEPEAYVVVFDSPASDLTAGLALGRADLGGAFGPLTLSGVDRTQVFLRVADAAGNVGPLARVRDTDWYAATTASPASGVPPSPHRLLEQPRAAGMPDPAQSVNRIRDPALAEADGVTLSTVGAGMWLSRLERAEPDWRNEAHVFNDLATNDLYLVGGTVSGSDVATCAGNSGACLDLHRRRASSWEPVVNTAAAGEDLPEFLGGFTVTYDVARSRVTGYDTRRRRLLEWTAQAWRPHAGADPTDLGPYRYSGARLTYDAVRGRLLLFGGNAAASGDCVLGFCNDTWTWNGAWRKETPATAPRGRTSPVLVYDSARDVVVLVGGFADVGNAGAACGDGSTAWEYGYCFYNDVWEYDGVNWSRRCDGSPAGDTCSQLPFRAELGAAVFDPDRGYTMLFGGRARPGAAGPACADGSAKDASGWCVYGTTWTWDGDDWARYDQPGGGSDTDPLERSGAALGFDLDRGTVVMFGGIRKGDVAHTGERRDTYAWTGSGWLRQKNPLLGAEPPRPRMNFAFARRDDTGAFLFGGEDVGDETCGGVSTIQCGDAHYWGYGLSTTPRWLDAACDIGASCPNEAGGVRAAWDPGTGEVVLAGGRADDSCDGTNEYCWPTWTADGLDEGWSWTSHTTTLIPRADHAMAEPGTAAHGNTVCNGAGPFVFGGRYGAGYLNDLKKYNSATGGWTSVCPGQGCTTQPAARAGAAMVCDDARDELILFGGELATGDCGSGGVHCADTWRYRGGNWEQAAVSDPEGDGNPAPRSFHVMIWDSSRGAVLVHGGRRVLAQSNGACGDGSLSVSNLCLFGDLWEWTGASWARVNVVDASTQGSPGRRAQHGMAHLGFRNESLLHGGETYVAPEINTWYWQSGFDGRPRQVFEVELAAAGLDAAAMYDLSVTWQAGGIADDGSCAARSGAELLVRQAGSWSVVDAHAADTTTPATLDWTFSQDAAWQLPGTTIRTLLLAGSRDTVSVAVQPRGASGCHARRAQVSTDYGEVRLSYRQPALVMP